MYNYKKVATAMHCYLTPPDAAPVLFRFNYMPCRSTYPLPSYSIFDVQYGVTMTFDSVISTFDL